MTDKQGRQVQRYANFGVDMMEWVDGGYVKHSEYMALLDELEAEKQDSAKWFKAFEKAVSVGARYEERIAEQQRSLDHREFLLLSADQVQREYAEALGCAGDNESILEAIDVLKEQVRTVDLSNGVLNQRIADQRGIILSARQFINEYAASGDAGADEFVKVIDRAAGIQSIEGEG